jgi:putative tryptophan/tyrosine transport system substrate-binding protein
MKISKRVCFLVSLSLSILAWISVSIAQPQKRPVRVGLIAFSRSELRTDLERSLIEGLRKRGYVEGYNLDFERHYADGNPDRVREIAAELAESKLDAIVTTCTPTTLVMKSATNSTPLVMASVSDPVGQKLIASYSRPGGNITGTASQFEELAPKMLELFHEAIPDVTAMAVIVNPTNPVHTIFLKEIDTAAASLKIEMTATPIARADELLPAMDNIHRANIRAVIVLPDDSFLFDLRPSIVQQVSLSHLPSFFGLREAVEEGGLMSYGEDLRLSYSRVAYYLDRIVKGQKPTDLPVEQPRKFELVVNRKTAKALGINLPASLLVQADEVIE